MLTPTLLNLGTIKLETVVSIPDNFSGEVILYVHGFKSSGYASTKAQKIHDAVTTQGHGFVGFNHRGNNLTFPDTMGYSKMDFQTMGEDVVAIYNYIQSLPNVKRIFPVAASLGATGLIKGLQQAPDLGEITAHMIFLAPCLVFGKYQKRYYSDEERNEWKQDGYRRELHFKKKSSISISFKLVQQGLDQEDALYEWIHATSIPYTVIHGSLDMQISTEEGQRMTTDPSQYIEIESVDHRFSRHTDVVIEHILRLVEGKGEVK